MPRILHISSILSILSILHSCNRLKGHDMSISHDQEHHGRSLGSDLGGWAIRIGVLVHLIHLTAVLGAY